jgi:glycerate 2-kinase
MKVLITPDKFKGTLDAIKVCQAIQEALHESGMKYDVQAIPMADGGEGTCDMLTEFSKGRKVKLRVLDPFFREIEAAYGISGDGTIAFVEMATASGLQLLKPEERNALLGTTYGTGQLIGHALDQGVKSVIMGVGGSGTNDAGIGMAQALGARFNDSTGKKLEPIGKNLRDIHSIDMSKLHPRLKEVSFTAICDVSNPFYGPQGAAHVFGPQKGADAEAVKFLDEGLRNFALIVRNQFGLDINFPGAGAGGGLGGGAKVFFNVIFQPGIQFITEFIGLERLVQLSDVIITGEGKMDEQTLSGKVVKGMADLALKYSKPLFVVVGKNELNSEKISSLGIKKIATLVNGKTTDAEAFLSTYSLIKKRTAEEIIPFLL